jgi:hypothetical protein
MGMPKKLVQVNYKFDTPRFQYEKIQLQWVQTFAEFRGLVWKIYLMNEEEKEAGGIILFEDESSAKSYLRVVEDAVNASPFFSDCKTKLFDIMDEHTQICRGPVN